MKKHLFLILFSIILLSSSACKPPEDLIIREEFFEENATSINMWCADFEEWQNELNINQRMDFNDIKDDGIQLKQVFVEQNDIDDRLRSARETNSTPDIYMISIGNLYKEVKNGYALDITSYFDTWDDLIDNAKEGVKYNNSYYGYPICLEPSTLLFYRKDLLLEYGKTETVPTKWDDFVELCREIKKNIKSANVKGLYTYDLPKGVDCAWATVGMQIAATGGMAISDNWTTSRLLEKGYTDLGNLWATMYQEGLVPLSSGAYNQYINDLCLGKQVLSTCGSWSVSEIINTYPELVDKIGISQMPTFDGNTNVTTATNGGWVYVISSSCKNVDKAVEVLKYLVAGNDTSRCEKYFEKAYYSKASPRKSVQNKINESMDTQELVPQEWIEIINSVSSKACLEPIYTWDICVAVEAFLEECAMGDNINKAQTKANTAVEKLIADNKLANNNPRG